jgi:alpha-D-xyloside xylohydrolase
LLVASFISWLSAGTARAQGLADYAGHQQVGRSVVIDTSSGQRVRITPYGDATVRVQVIASGSFLADDYHAMVARHDQGGSFAIVEDGSVLELTSTAGARIVITKAPLRLAFHHPGTAVPFLAGGNTIFSAGVAQRFARDPAERFVGLGHGFLGRVPRLELTNTEVERNYGLGHGDQAPLIVPFYLSSKGYGVFVNSSASNRFRFGAGGVYEIALVSTEMDFFVFAGPSLPDVLSQYTELTGRPRLPPLAMFGLALSDKAHASESTATWWQQKVQAHRAAGWPLDHLVNDNRWRAGGGERCVSRFAWDVARYPDPASFRSWMEARGLVATLDFNRCIANQSAGWMPSFNLPQPGSIDFGASAPDFSRSDVRAWWWSLMWQQALDPALAYPGDALWIDEFDEMGTASADQVLGNGRTWGEMRNVWFLMIARALGEEGWDRALDRRPFTWVRGMTAGGQRSATLWSGDIDPSYAEMKLQIRGMLAAGLAGFPFWGHDAGGFHGDPISAAQFDEIYRQWAIASGAFSPFWKPHGTVHSRWPSDRSPDAQHAATVYGELRYRLLPYTYSFARQASEDGMPIARAMMLAHPEQPDAWTYDLQYLWGAELLVAPNAAPGYNTVSVWLPPGRWYDFWSDMPFDGGRVIQTRAPPGRVPLYAKAGAIVPMAPAASSSRFMRRDVIDLHVWDGADGSFALREDDGTTEAYRESAERITTITYTAMTRTLTIHAATGTFEGAVPARRYRIHVHGLPADSCASIDGVPVADRGDEQTARVLGSGTAWAGHADRGVFSVYVRTTPVGQPLAIQVTPCSRTVPTRLEAETASTNATVSAKPTASAGMYVGALNGVGRYVEVAYDAPAAGAYDVTIGYANGRARRASRGLYINGTRVRDLFLPSTPDWDAFSIATVRVRLEGGHAIIRIQTDPEDEETIDLDYIELSPSREEPPLFYQGLDDSGLLVVETEHWSEALDVAGLSWRSITYAEHYAGNGAVRAEPNLGRVVATPEPAPRLAYRVHFARAGTHYVWVRGHAYGNQADDEVAIGIDDMEARTVALAASDYFVWAGGTGAAISIDAAGVHTLVLAMREDGAIVDRVLLTTDPDYTPEGIGPDESPHEPPRPPADDDPASPASSGCGCQSTSVPSASVWASFVAFVWLLRRRRVYSPLSTSIGGLASRCCSGWQAVRRQSRTRRNRGTEARWGHTELAAECRCERGRTVIADACRDLEHGVAS